MWQTWKINYSYAIAGAQGTYGISGDTESQARARSLRALETTLGEFGLYFTGSENMFELQFLWAQYEGKKSHISSRKKGVLGKANISTSPHGKRINKSGTQLT